MAVSHQDQAPGSLTAALSILVKSNGLSHKLSGTVLGNAPVLCEIDGATFVTAVVLQGNVILYNSDANGKTFSLVTGKYRNI